MKTRILLALFLALALLCGGALAETDFDFDATVVCMQPVYVTAAIGGTVGAVPALAGQQIGEGDALAELSTNKVYAPADGTVTGLFCEPGDSISDINNRYGALMYIEPNSKYTLTASTDNAYNQSANKYIHVGEAVYLSCSDGTHKGEGFVTSVSGTDFNVEVTSGGFYMGETVSVYRDESRATKSRIGKGDIARIANVTVTGPENGGSVVVLHVQEGSSVKAGDLLMETLNGEYDARYCTGSTLKSSVKGIVASVEVKPGANVSKGDVIAAIYPTDGFQLETQINEVDLSVLTVGTPVRVSFNWNEDDEDAESYDGVVSRVLYTPVTSEGSDSTTYAAYIDFEADDSIRLGMTATVRSVNGDEDEAEVEDEDEADEEAEEASR